MTTAKYIPLSTLEEITNEFSLDLRIGRGGFADVYKGVYNGRHIAVKLVHVDTVRGLDDQQFKNEVGNLSRAKHKNIVPFVGYCYETRKKYVHHNGLDNFSEHIYRVICFDYLHGGSLEKRLDDQSFAPDWSTRYNVIKGICEGLNFLHKSVPPILHLDLKPANILLDSSMEPKVADLGLSRLFTQSHTHVTEKVAGTRKYMPPEFINEGMISPKNDIFSLGVVMIEIMKGPAGHSNSFEMGDLAQLMQQELPNWSTVIEATSKYPLEEIDQVMTCMRLAICCVDSERNNRPSIEDILDTLNMTEANIPKKKADWNAEAPAIFGATTSLSGIKIKDARKQVSGQGSKSAKTSSKAPANTSAKHPGAYHPPQFKHSVALQDKVIDFPSKPDNKQHGSSGMPESVQVVTIKHMEKAPLFDHNTKVMLELTGGDYTSARPGLDLVAVLDVGCGCGRMMNEVKTAMRFVLQKLGPMDRLSVVAFGSEATKLCPLRQINEGSWQELHELIDRLESHKVSLVNFTDGLRAGLKVLEDRKVMDGRVAAIMLVVGKATGTPKHGKVSYSNVPVYTFCLSNSHDYKALGEVAANSMGGTFSVLGCHFTGRHLEPRAGGLTMAFSQCLAGLLTVAVQDLEVTLATVPGESMLLKVTAGSYPQRHYHGSVTVCFGDLYSREVRKVIVDLGLPTVASERSTEFLSVTYSYRSRGSSARRVQHVVPVEMLTVWRTAVEVLEEEVTPAEFQMEEDHLRTTQMMEDYNMRLIRKRDQLCTTQNNVPLIIMEEEAATFSTIYEFMLMDEEAQTIRAVEMIQIMEANAQKIQVEAQKIQVDPLLKIELMEFLASWTFHGPCYLLSSRSSHGRQRFAWRSTSSTPRFVRLFATPRMDMYLEQAKRFIQYPHIRLPSTDQDDVASSHSSQHPIIYDVASREEELRVLSFTIED